MSFPIFIACLTCANNFADHDGGGNPGGLAILTMLIVLGGIFSLLVGVMVLLSKRERANLDPRFIDPADQS